MAMQHRRPCGLGHRQEGSVTISQLRGDLQVVTVPYPALEAGRDHPYRTREEKDAGYM